MIQISPIRPYCSVIGSALVLGAAALGCSDTNNDATGTSTTLDFGSPSAATTTTGVAPSAGTESGSPTATTTAPAGATATPGPGTPSALTTTGGEQTPPPPAPSSTSSSTSSSTGGSSASTQTTAAVTTDPAPSTTGTPTEGTGTASSTTTATTTTGSATTGSTNTESSTTPATTVESTATSTSPTSTATETASTTDTSSAPLPDVDPDAHSRVDGWIDTLPWGQSNMSASERVEIVDAIVRSCEQFAPPGADWQIYCQAHMTAAINKESSYTVHANDIIDTPGRDTYSTRDINGTAAYDPTIGLTQIRFSSTVKDYSNLGPLDKLAAIGCDMPDLGHTNDSGDSQFWAVDGPQQHLDLMYSVPCNVGLGAWYYYYNATGNGVEGSPTYLYQYCQGQGTAATLRVGLLSHLNGPSGAYRTDQGSMDYVNLIKEWFDGMLGPITPHPFDLLLAPEPSKYCR